MEGDLEATKSRVARRRAQNNVEEWGQQAPGTLAAALTEELGELLEEVIPEDNEPWGMTNNEYAAYIHLQNVQDYSLAVQSALDKANEADEDFSLAAQEEMDVQAVREELYDIMALCYQLDWALYQGVEADAE